MKPTKITLALLLFAAMLLSLAAPSSASAARLPGIDVSRFNGTINWTLVAGSGVRFAMIAASRGNGSDCAVKSDSCGADPNFLVNSTNARAAGVRVGAYHRAFVTGGSLAAALADARYEADIFIGSLGAFQPGDLLPALDVETPFVGVDAAGLRAWIRAFIVRVKKRTGVRPMIYTNASSWGATGNTPMFAKRSPLWVAEWQVRRPSVPAGNWGGRGWTVWQHTSSGSVPGISGRVDLNWLGVAFRKISIPY